jgi:SAM-dependent methyltransferase
MQSDQHDDPFWLSDPAKIDAFREVLDRAGFSDSGVGEAIGIENLRPDAGREVALLLRRTSRLRALDTLIRLFLIGVPVDAQTVRQAVSPLDIEDMVRAGLLATAGGAIAGAVQLLPFRGMILAHDLARRIESALAADYVMGIGSSTLTLANCTVRRHSSLTLDLGTGCGLLALVAASHSDRVLAVDRNPRAVQMARFNARLNGLSGVECREGDLFEPVRNDRFDLVVSNPPFVISPERRYIYRDSGMHGDEISQKIVRQVPDFLREGGFCQILCNWAHLAGQPWEDRLAAWFEGTGCDAWVMRSDTFDAESYAVKWIRHTEHDDAERFSERLNEWLDYYQRERIEAVSGGLITLRRRSGEANWFRADDAPPKMLGPAGASIELGFQLRDFLESASDDRIMLDACLRCSPDVRLHQDAAPAGDGWQVTDCRLELTRGLAYTGDADPYIAALLARCDDRRALGGLLDELAASLGQDRTTFLPRCLAIIRRLIERGFLLPAS